MKELRWAHLALAGVIVLIVLRPRTAPKTADLRPIPTWSIPRRIEVDPAGVPFID